MPTTTSSLSHRRRFAGGAALLTALALVLPATAAQAGTRAVHATRPVTGLATVTAAPALPAGARALGPVAATAQVVAAVALRLPDPNAVTRFVADASNPRSSAFHHYLGRGAFATRFGPRPATIATVRRALVGDGLVVTGVSANRLLVTFHGTAGAVEAAFHTGLERVRLANGRVGQATTRSVRLPSVIARNVQAVIGLDHLVKETDGLTWGSHHGTRASQGTSQPHTSGGPVACAAALSQSQFGALTDQQVATSYGVNPLYTAGDTAAGQTIDVYELEPFALSDIQGFDECYFGADHTSQLSVINVDGGSGTGFGGGEAALDVEDVSAIAPGATIHVFSGPNMDNPFGPLDTWNAIAVADDAGQVTSSWGLCETILQEGAPGVQAVENEIFEQTAAQGQTIFSSAGDDGSDDCAGHAASPVSAALSVDDPASQPYVTSVGGTTIVNPTEPPAETVWNNGNDGGAGGGGISETWAMPSWQSGLAVTQGTADQACSNDPTGTADNFHVQGVGTTLPSGTLCREVPDVSALADPQTGITIEYAGQWFPIGGTSSSTPLWAAMLAEINGSAGCTSVKVGFADPLLYELAGSSAQSYANAFSDVTAGNNDNLGVGGAIDWAAGTGYDEATGLGTPRVTDSNGNPGLASELCALAAGGGGTQPVVTGLSVSSGHSAGGGTTEIDGSNFGASQGSVYFGTVGASVVGWTPTAVTVDVPAYNAPQGSPSGLAGSAVVTVVTAGPTSASSSPSSSAVFHYTAASTGAPVVDYVSEPTGPTAGGTTATIVGAGLTGATAVHFGSTLATGLTVLSDDELTVTVPASTGTCAVPISQGMCAVAVTVTTPGGTSAVPTILPAYQGPIVFAPDGSFSAPVGCGCEVVQAPGEYDYVDAPTISSVAPTYESADGSTAIEVTGTGFNLLDFFWSNVGTAGQDTSEDFSILGVTPTSLDLVVPQVAPAPAIEPFTLPFSIQTSGGLSNVTTLSFAGIPTITSLSTHVAAQSSPGTVTITGNGLIDVTSLVLQLQGPLSFLSSTSTSFSAQTDTSLTATIPEGFASPADVLLCTASGCTGPDPQVDTLTLAYPGRPVVHSSAPNHGPAHGGTTVTINGALDSEVTAVDFGSTPATILSEPTFTPSGPIVVLAPPGTAGHTVDLTITTLGGTIATPPAPRSAVTGSATFTYAASTPSAPRSVTSTSKTSHVTVRWAAPADDGGDPVTGYVLVATAKGHATVRAHPRSTARSATVTLTAHVAWKVTLQAVNKLGDGLAATFTVRPG